MKKKCGYVRVGRANDKSKGGELYFEGKNLCALVHNKKKKGKGGGGKEENGLERRKHQYKGNLTSRYFGSLRSDSPRRESIREKRGQDTLEI